MNSKVKSADTFTIVDNKTGEVVSNDAIFFGQNPYHDKGFRKVFVGFLKDIVLDKEIAGKAIRLLLWIIENLKTNDLEIYMYHEYISEELGITKKTYYNWLNVLLKKGIVEKTDRPHIYRIRVYSAVNGYEKSAIARKNNQFEQHQKKIKTHTKYKQNKQKKQQQGNKEEL